MKVGQHFSIPHWQQELSQNSCQLTIKTGDSHSLSKVWNCCKNLFQPFFPNKNYCFLTFSFSAPWSLTGKTLLLALCTLERWASFCTFWKTRIPVSDISPSSTLFLEGGKIHWNFTNWNLWTHFDGCLVLYIIWLPYYSVQANVAVHFFEAVLCLILMTKTLSHQGGVAVIAYNSNTPLLFNIGFYRLEFFQGQPSYGDWIVP